MSMKVLPRANKNHNHHNCPRERCHGDSKDYQNYLVNKPKMKRPNTTRSHPSIHQHFAKQAKPKPAPKQKAAKPESDKKQVEELRRKNSENNKQNSELLEQLQQKSRKINDLKHRLKDSQNLIKNYEARIKEYESRCKQDQYKILHLQSIINENDNPKSPISLERPTEQLIMHYQQQIKSLEASQQVMLQHLQKYRSVQKETQQQRSQNQSKIQQLIRQNQRLRHYQPFQNNYDQELTNLKHQIHRLRQQTPITTKISHSMFENEVIALKTANKELLNERESLLCKLNDQYDKQEQLKRNLQAINRKVERWGDQYRKMTQETRIWKERNEQLELKLEHKREKHQMEKEEWARIFKQMMREVQRLKQDVARFDRPKAMEASDIY